MWCLHALAPLLSRHCAVHVLCLHRPLLGRRVVTMVGASLVRATVSAMQCSLEGAGLRREHELQWRNWGWGTFAQDNGGCGTNFTALRNAMPMGGRVQRFEAAGCVGLDGAFDAMLRQTDVAVVAYNPQHCAPHPSLPARTRAARAIACLLRPHARCAQYLVPTRASNTPAGVWLRRRG